MTGLLDRLVARSAGAGAETPRLRAPMRPYFAPEASPQMVPQPQPEASVAAPDDREGQIAPPPVFAPERAPKSRERQTLPAGQGDAAPAAPDVAQNVAQEIKVRDVLPDRVSVAAGLPKTVRTETPSDATATAPDAVRPTPLDHPQEMAIARAANRGPAPAPPERDPAAERPIGSRPEPLPKTEPAEPNRVTSDGSVAPRPPVRAEQPPMPAPPAATPERTAPSLSIGHIDVIIEAPDPPPSPKQTPRRAALQRTRGFDGYDASRLGQRRR